MVKQELARIKDLVEARASQVFAKRCESVTGMGSFASQFMKDLSASVGGGKAVRAAFVFYGAIACADEEPEALTDLALAMEMFHTYLLMHDDIIDQDDLRRGKPAFHALYRDRRQVGVRSSQAQHFGMSMGILGGDVLASMAYEVLCQANLEPARKLEILSQANRMLFETGVGEVLDVLNVVRSEASRAHILKVHALKTSRYSFATPLLMGAAACGASSRQRELLEQFALPMGIAYQLQDDLLGLFGDEATTGKSAMSDLRQGKQTLLMIEAYERASASQRRVLDVAVGNRAVTPEMADHVRSVVRETGAYAYSTDLARRFHQMALPYLDEAHLSLRGREFLTQIAEYIISREY